MTKQEEVNELSKKLSENHAKLKASELTPLLYVLATIETAKQNIAKERDKLRKIYDELDALLESFNTGIDNIENGKREIEIGIDELSQYV